MEQLIFWTIKAIQFLETLLFFGVWSIQSGYIDVFFFLFSFSLEINYYMQFTRP